MSARTIAIGRRGGVAQRVTYVASWVGSSTSGPVRPSAVGCLWTAGQPFRIAPAGYKAVDSLRLEKGYRVLEQRITRPRIPTRPPRLCVRLTSPTSSAKALVRIKAQGLPRRLCTVTLIEPPGPTRALYGERRSYAGAGGGAPQERRATVHGGQAHRVRYLPLEPAAGARARGRGLRPAPLPPRSPGWLTTRKGSGFRIRAA